jgi:protease IV
MDAKIQNLYARMAGPMLLRPSWMKNLLGILESAGGQQITASNSPPDYEVIGGVAVLPICGVLVPYSLGDEIDAYLGIVGTDQLLQNLNAANADAKVRAIVFDIDTPGGFVSGTVEFADAVAASPKPTIASIRGICCSGGYWIASQCDEIWSRPESEVGNIGVFSVLEDCTGLLKQLGVKLQLVSSGQFKGLGADGKVTKDFIADQNRIVGGLFFQFIGAIETGRGMSTATITKLADGKAYLGDQAKSLGLVDRITTDASEPIAAAANGKPTAGRSAGARQPGDPAGIAAREWAANANNCRETFVDEPTYIAARKRELEDASEPVAKAPRGDPAKIAAREWAANHGNVQERFVDEAVYIAARKRELEPTR